MPVAPVRGRSEEELAWCLLPVACPHRDLWTFPILMVRIARAWGFGTGFTVLMERIYIDTFTPEHKTADTSAPKGSHRIA